MAICPRRLFWLAAVIAVVACRGVSAQECADVLRRLADAHAQRPRHAFTMSAVIQVDPEMEKMLRAEPGAWSVRDYYTDLATGQRLPITSLTTIGVDENLRAVTRYRVLIGTVSAQANTSTEIISPTEWMPSVPEGRNAVATVTTNIVDSPAESRRHRLAGRMPHRLNWADTTYITMVTYCIENLKAAPDLVCVRDQDATLLSSAYHGTEIWVDDAGEVPRVRLQWPGGDLVRHEFSGRWPAAVYPARLPREVRVFNDRVNGVDGDPSVHAQFELFSEVTVPAPAELLAITPQSLGVQVREVVAKPVQDSALASAAITVGLPPRRGWQIGLVVLAVIAGVGAFVAFRYARQRRA